MESLSDSLLLKFNPGTLQSVRKEYHLDDPKILNEAIDLLEDWVKRQTHFLKTDYTRQYLEITIITTKGSVERAKSRLDKLCTLKTLLPNYFSIYNINELQDLSKYLYLGHSNKLTKDNYRFFMLKVTSLDFDSSFLLDFYRASLILSEYIRCRDYVNGFIILLDYRDINIVNLVTKLNPIDLRNMMTLLMEGYGMRIKGIHILSASKMIDTLIGLIKQVVSSKVAGRVHVHQNLDSLYVHIPREILPKDYGGDERPIAKIQSDWIDVVGSKENVEYTKEIFNAGTNEGCRQANKFTEEYSGMPGSFRSLTVD